MKKLIFSVLAVAAMASCSKSELVERPVVGEAEIRANSYVLKLDQGKAPVEGITSTTPLTARVLASTVEHEFEPVATTPATNTAAFWADDTMTFTDDNTTPVGFATPVYYPTDGKAIYLCGLYPTTGWTDFSKNTTNGVQSTSAKFTFDGKTDVMVASEQKTLKSEALQNQFKTLTFSHMLTKLVVSVVADDQAAIDAWGKVTEISLRKVGGADVTTLIKPTINTATATAGNTDFFPSANKVDSLPFYVMTSPTVATDDAFVSTDATKAVTLTTTAAPVAYSIVTPLIATGTADYQLRVKTENNKAGFDVDVNLKTMYSTAFTGTTQGQAFAITLRFQAQEIKGLGTVTAWVDAGNAEEIIK